MIKQILHNLSKCVILYRSFLMHGEGNQAVSLRFSGERYCEKKKKKKKKNLETFSSIIYCLKRAFTYSFKSAFTKFQAVAFR